MPEPKNAWLYTRGSTSVLMETIRRQGSFELRINGPGKQRAFRKFADSAALMIYQTEYESQLVAAGYTLEQYRSDRRRWPRPPLPSTGDDPYDDAE